MRAAGARFASGERGSIGDTGRGGTAPWTGARSLAPLIGLATGLLLSEAKPPNDIGARTWGGALSRCDGCKIGAGDMGLDGGPLARLISDIGDRTCGGGPGRCGVGAGDAGRNLVALRLIGLALDMYAAISVWSNCPSPVDRDKWQLLDHGTKQGFKKRSLKKCGRFVDTNLARMRFTTHRRRRVRRRLQPHSPVKCGDVPGAAPSSVQSAPVVCAISPHD